jgi:cysteinyl-tRNA synthetase
LADDFNTALALSIVWEWVREANKSDGPVGDCDLREMLGVFALENLLEGDGADIPAEVVALAEAREQARSGKDFAESDRLRDEIAELGYVVRDVAGGFELVPK